MMNNSFIMLQGTLTVCATGYWYTNGGEKGSFGYYPHLKSNQQQPVFPDTQIHGDLRMAAQWLAELNPEKSYASLIKKIFGYQGNELNSLLHIQDLTLNAASQAKWSPTRFNIKSRIELDDETRSLKDKMLASFESAWLEGLSLEAPLYAGYFTDEAEADSARQLLEEAVQLISGFGALRSRGYGRGKISIKWQDLQQVTIDPQDVSDTSFSYALKNLVNMRSKPVAVERLQLVATNTSISAEQLRGWFVRTYKEVSGKWPQTDEMEKITFSDFFPSPSTTEPAFPPANTILRREDGVSIDDYWGKTPEDEAGQTIGEKVAGKCKLKPLQAGTYITANRTIVHPMIGTRLRNAIQEDFKTLEEGGLFVQQYVPQGTIFCGQITISEPRSDFGRTSVAILKQFKPVINGSIFEPTINNVIEVEDNPHKIRLVSMPIHFDPLKVLSNDESISLGTQRRYAPALGRPRRGLPVILPGSIVADDTAGTINWPLFGENIAKHPPTSKQSLLYEKPDVTPSLPQSGINWGKITRSQAGILRELLNPGHNCEVIGKYLAHIQEKHSEKDRGSDLTKLYIALVSIHKKEDIEGLRQTVQKKLEYLKIAIWWEQKKPNQSGGHKQ